MGTRHGRKRKVYELTAEGQEKLTERRAEWTRFSSVMSQVLVAPA